MHHSYLHYCYTLSWHCFRECCVIEVVFSDLFRSDTGCRMSSVKRADLKRRWNFVLIPDLHSDNKSSVVDKNSLLVWRSDWRSSLKSNLIRTIHIPVGNSLSLRRLEFPFRRNNLIFFLISPNLKLDKQNGMFAAGTWLYYYALQINDELNANQLKTCFLLQEYQV